MNLIKRYFGWIDHLLSKQVDATGLALFRIAYSTILLCEISQIIYFRHLIYDKVPFLIPSEINMLPGLIVWFISVVFILFGFYTKRAALVNYVLSLVFIGTIKSYEYHVFYTYMGTNFLFMFLDISKNHSLDRLREKLKYSTSKFQYNPSKKIGVLHYFLPIAVGVGFVYFDSIFFKLASYNWMNGLGMWLPASLPMATHVDVTLFLNIKWLAIGLGYLTVLFELVFLFTFFLKRFRIPLLIIGSGLHLGIIIIFPIPWFGLTVLAVYLLMIPHSFWRWLGAKIKSQEPSLTVYYDQDCPLCTRTKIIVEHVDYKGNVRWKGIDARDESLEVSEEEMYASMHATTSKGRVVKGVDTYRQIFRRIPFLYPLFLILSIPGVYHLSNWIYGKIAKNRISHHCTDETCGFVPPTIPEVDSKIRIFSNLSLRQIKSSAWGLLFLLLVFFQINVTFHSKLINDSLFYTKTSNSSFTKTISNYSKKLRGASKVVFGITSHGVFMDSHFEDYNHILALEAEFGDGSKKWLPIIKKDGTAGWYNFSFNWVKWTFRVMNNHVDQEKLELGIRDFATFWAIDNDYDLNDLKFNVYIKPLEIPKRWEKDFLRKQKAKKWVKIGEGEWVNSDFLLSLPTIENIIF